MSRLSRAVNSQRAVIEAHQRDLRRQVSRFNESLGERAADPGWLAAAFGAGVFAGLRFGRPRPKPEPSEEGERHPWLSGLIRDFGVPFAMNLLQQYLAHPPEPEREPQEPAPETAETEEPPQPRAE